MEDNQILMPKSTTTDREAVVVVPTTDREAVVVVSKDVVVGDENPSSQDSKHVEFSLDEETLIIRMYNLVGERWSLIAGRIPGRSAEEIEKYWNSKHSTCSSEHKEPEILINLN